MAITRNFRVGGSGFTTIRVNGTAVSFCRMANDVSPAPVGTGTVPIHPMDEERPIELITPQAASMGTLTLEIYDRWSARFWNQLAFTKGGLADIAKADDIVDILRTVGKEGSVGVTKTIKGPQDNGGNSTQKWIYHGCVVSNIMDGDTTEVGTMEVLKQIVINYRKVTDG